MTLDEVEASAYLVTWEASEEAWCGSSHSLEKQKLGPETKKKMRSTGLGDRRSPTRSSSSRWRPLWRPSHRQFVFKTFRQRDWPRDSGFTGTTGPTRFCRGGPASLRSWWIGNLMIEMILMIGMLDSALALKPDLNNSFIQVKSTKVDYLWIKLLIIFLLVCRSV